MPAEHSVLESIFKIAGIVVPIVSTVVTGLIWCVKRIEKGQNKLWKKYRKLSERHTEEMAKVNSELAQKVSLLQCENLRNQCPCQQLSKDAVDNNNIIERKKTK